MMHTFLFLSGGELLLVFLVFLLLFGSSKIPEMAKGLGKGLRELKKATDDIKREINESTNGITQEISSTTSDIRKNISEITTNISQDIETTTSEVKKEVNEVAKDVNT
jgi:sec-independent protein translocase protein TatA